MISFSLSMTFEELFGNKEKIALLDFLSDYPRYWYTTEEIKERWIFKNISPKEALSELENEDLISISMAEMKKIYKINTENKIIKAVLKHDFEKAKKIADIT